jgi:ribose transport system substrate-binding protein
LLPDLPIESFVRMDSRGLRDKGYKLTREFLLRHPRDRGILIAAHNDTVALGVLEAVRELEQEQTVAIAGQDCIAEAIEEIKRPGSPLIASVDHFAESYGERLIALGLNILRGQAVPPYNFTEYKMVTQASLKASDAQENRALDGDKKRQKPGPS